ERGFMARSELRGEGRLDQRSTRYEHSRDQSALHVRQRGRCAQPEVVATVKISVDAEEAVAIPRSAVLRFGEQTLVYFVRRPKDDKERFERLPVTVDEGEGSEWLTVDHGLEKGDKVVTGGAILLSGML